MTSWLYHLKMYAVVCGKKTSQWWPKALSKLEDKYESRWPGRVHTILYSESSGSVRSCLKQLSEIKPYFTCFLTHHSQCSRDFVQQVNKLTRELDPSHPFTDTIWGILTGLHEDDVLAALDHAPLSIQRVVGNCPIDMEKFGSGVWFSEFEKGVSYCKGSRLSAPSKKECPHDTTELIVQELSKERRSGVGEDGNPIEQGVDMIISSGHATEQDWNIAYGFKGGKFLCRNGQLYGSPLRGDNIDVQRSKTPKILSAAGNCLMGHISDEHCMALGWMHSASVIQMIGYVEPTWFGYGGWGVHKYFINNPGSMSFSEAFFANQQSLLHELYSKYGHHLDATLENHRSVYSKCFNTSASAREDISRDCSGLIYDRDNVAFYGDPAWRAELEVHSDVYDFM